MNSTEKWRAYYSPVGRIRMLGGHPALDLANTLHWRDGVQLDFVSSYRSLVDWAEAADLLSETEKSAVLARAERHEAETRSIYIRWLELRAELKAWLPAINGKDQDLWRGHSNLAGAPALLAKIQEVAAEAPLAAFYAMGASQEFSPRPDLPLLRSATSIWSLMHFPPTGIIRQCEADSCGGYFVDQSRAKPRRWCSMDSCGNRAKAKRHRHAAAHH